MLRTNVPKGIMRPEIVRTVTGNFEHQQKLSLLDAQLKEAKKIEPRNIDLHKAIRKQMKLLLQSCVHTPAVPTSVPSERTFEERMNLLPDGVVTKKRKGK